MVSRKLRLVPKGQEKRFCGFSNNGAEDGSSCQMTLPRISEGTPGQTGRLKSGQEISVTRRQGGRAGETQDQMLQSLTGTQPALGLPEPAEGNTNPLHVPRKQAVAGSEGQEERLGGSL